MKKITVIGAGLAGSEAALQTAKRGIKTDLYEMRPEISTGAHKTGDFAELVCSNSFGSYDISIASGLLKHELEILGSELMPLIMRSKVPAGGALAAARDVFSASVTKKILEHPNINVIRKEVCSLDFDNPVIIAAGPLASEKLSEKIKEFTGENYLHFYDAIAPIIEKDSINFDKAFYMNRYGKGSADYINCPMTKEEYEKFYNILINAPKIELKTFEKDAAFFEACLPVEVLASRGIDTLRFGPMKPAGLIDGRTDIENYAVVQLRQDNMAANLYNIVGFQTNLKWSAQKELIHSIPGLENAEIARYGVMHRNTFINSPRLLNSSLQSLKNPNIFFAGQITGTEGYTEAIASGLSAGINAVKYINGEKLIELPPETMLGALIKYITFKEHSDFQPVNSNWGILPALELNGKKCSSKKEKKELLAARALSAAEKIKKEF